MQRALTFARELLISALIGAALSSFYAIGQPRGHFSLIIVHGAAVGVCIYLSIALLQLLFGRWIRLLPERWRVYAEGLLFLVGGLNGWVLGFAVAAILTRTRFSIDIFRDPTARIFMLITAGIALVVGLLFRAFDVLGGRLRRREWAERELEMARSIQARLLPPPALSGDGYSLEARNLAAHYVAGDFYDFILLDDGSIVIVVADVAGKGMGASLTMASVKAVLPFVARDGVPEAMRLLNRKLVAELPKREFVALVCARFAPASRTIEIANAGCPDPYLVRDGAAEAVAIEGERLPLGLRENVHYATRTVQLAPGDRLLFLSDGIPEAPAANGEPLGYDELTRIVASTDGEQWLDALLAEVRSRTQETLADDWTAVALRVGGLPRSSGRPTP